MELSGCVLWISFCLAPSSQQTIPKWKFCSGGGTLCAGFACGYLAHKIKADFTYPTICNDQTNFAYIWNLYIGSPLVIPRTEWRPAAVNQNWDWREWKQVKINAPIRIGLLFAHLNYVVIVVAAAAARSRLASERKMTQLTRQNTFL